MNSADIFIVALCMIGAALALWFFKKSGHFFKSLFLSAVSGVGGLFFVNLISSFTGIKLGANIFTLLFSVLTGLSGVIAMLIMRLI